MRQKRHAVSCSTVDQPTNTRVILHTHGAEALILAHQHRTSAGADLPGLRGVERLGTGALRLPEELQDMDVERSKVLHDLSSIIRVYIRRQYKKQAN